MDEAFNARSDLDERTVVGDDDDLTLDGVTHLEVLIESIPRMRSELLETQGDTLLVVVEVEDDDLDLLVQLDHLFGVRDAAPAEVGDVDETVDATEVDEHTVAGDVLDHAFEDLTLLELADDFGLLGFQLILDEGFVRHNHVLELLVDLHHLELHHAVNKHIVVANRLDIDLAAGQEGFEAEHFDDETTLGAALDITVDDLAAFVGFVDAIPRLEQLGFLVREDELAIGAFLVLNVDFHLVAHLQVRAGAELCNRDDAVRLEADVDDHFAVGDGHHSAFDDLVVSDLAHGAGVLLFELGTLVG